MIDLKYTEIIKKNKELENTQTEPYSIAVLSNIMVHQSKDICEYMLRKEAINAKITLGDYDNIVQDSKKFSTSNVVIIFWEIYNIIDGLQYKIDLLSQEELSDIVQKIKMEIDIVLGNIASTPLVIMNKFSDLIFSQYNLDSTNISNVVLELNEYLQNNKTVNLKLIDLTKVFSSISIGESIDLRYFYSSKTLYSINFYKNYFEYIKPHFLSSNGKIKKALIFDCDNTLWKGVLGEDGFDNIKMFKEVQYLAKQLAKKGVIIGLCSKNNPEDVEEVLLEHNEMILKNEDIVIKKVNWNNKATNLEEITKELNIGLDSLVFIDDSDFEINLVKEALPMIHTIQVPKKEYEYNMLMRKISTFFYNSNETKEDLAKVQMYKAQVQRANAKDSVRDIETYLKSLGLVITLYIDDISQMSRVSQMTQKTNQFNLTTHRYTEQDIENFIKDEHKTVLCIGVKDKFGDNGVVGLTILEHNQSVLNIDTLLMSCRVLGRNIEYKFMDLIIELGRKKEAKKVVSSYIRTLKNDQVSDLYDRYGFLNYLTNEGEHLYSLDIDSYEGKDLDYIGVEHG